MNSTSFSFRHQLVLRLIAVCWLVSKLSSYTLWLSKRYFPMVPVSNIFGYLPDWLFLGTLIASSALLLFLIIKPDRRVVFALVILEIFVCLADQNRWQTWEYEFILMAGCVAFIGEKNKAFRAMQLVVAVIYFFGGIHLLHGSFINEIWDKLILVRTLGIRESGPIILRAGYMVALLEIAAGICLLLKRGLQIAIPLIYIIHIGVLLGPWLVDYGLVSSSWAWFAMMPLIVSALFWKEQPVRTIAWKQPFFAYIIIVLCWIMPWGMIAGKWDRNLSFIMYGGGQDQLYVCTENKFYPYGITRFIGYGNRVPCKFVVGISAWGRHDLNVPVNAERRILKVIAGDWQKAFGDSSTTFYFYREGFKRKVEQYTAGGGNGK